ncbi:hypothetical protein [Erwinia sp. SLM-02]|uniref:hypothetical protein n=1 Tax=Erwinia sp. SLM-02 TaxID=3020057 RepID=UPI0030810101
MGRVFITEGVRTGPDGSGYSCEDDDERADSWDVVDSDSGAKYFGSEDYSTATRVSGVLNAICREHAAEVARLNEQMRALVAENAALKSGIGFFSYGTDSGYEEHATADDAIKAADSDIDYYRGDACAGWSDETDRTVWGVVIQRASMIGLHTETDDSGNKREICDYALLPVVETPATDAILREVGAKAIEGFVKSLEPAWNGTTDRALKYAAAIRAGEVPNV